jgi:glycine hydroxymethyltransferase
MALCRPGDTILELDATGGGHRLGEKLKAASIIDLNVLPLPFDARRFNLDVDRCRDLIAQVRPRLVILGSSSFLFPHPVSRIRAIVDTIPECYLLYDASHVLGLIAGGCFQDPLEEGAHLVSASTHKTFCGPQGGLVLTNDKPLAERVAQAIYPALVTNHHLHRLPALGAACLEWLDSGPEHAKTVIENAQAFGRALTAHQLDVVRNGQVCTSSHTVLAATRAHGRMGDLALRLEEAGIIAGATVLPELWGRGGIRFGVQELTRRGMMPDDAEPIAALIADILSARRTPAECREEVRHMARRLDHCLFSIE